MKEIRYEVLRQADGQYALFSIASTDFGREARNWITSGSLSRIKMVLAMLGGNIDGEIEE